jgi:hydrogenase/urease accessory protein HupE
MRAAAVALLLAAPAALAHQPSVSFSELSVRGREVSGALRFSIWDLRTQMRIDDPAHPPLPALRHLLLDPFRVQAQGHACALQEGVTAGPDGEDGLALVARWLCPEVVDELSVRAGFIETLPPGHTHLSRIDFGGGEVSQRVAQAGDPDFEARRSRSPSREFARFLLLGVEHIFTGYDHIAFLIGLLLLGGTIGELVKIVTAFTVAHSLTLALATLGVLTPSSRVVEPLIAASIAFVGAENLWALRNRKSETALRHRWMVTFAFGLVHGFGFASVLRELQLPRPVLATGLVSFNLGVEVGQIAIVLVAFPLLRRLRAVPRFAFAGSASVAVLGAIWTLQRLL